MSSPDEVRQVTQALQNRLNQIIAEYNLTVAEVLGVLEVIKLDVFLRSREDQDDDD